MKRKFIVPWAVTVCFLFLTAMTVGAETTAPSRLLAFQEQGIAYNLFSMAFGSLGEFWGLYRGLFESWGLGECYFVPPVLLLMIVSLFGYRINRFLTAILSGVIGFALTCSAAAYAETAFDLPSWLVTAMPVLRWVSAATVAILILAIALLLRRVGLAATFAGIVTLLLAAYTSNTTLLLIVLAATFLLVLLAAKPFVIYGTSLFGSFTLIKLLFRQGGALAFDLSATLGVVGIDAWIIVSLLLAFIFVMFQERFSKNRKYC